MQLWVGTGELGDRSALRNNSVFVRRLQPGKAKSKVQGAACCPTRVDRSAKPNHQKGIADDGRTFPLSKIQVRDRGHHMPIKLVLSKLAVGQVGIDYDQGIMVCPTNDHLFRLVVAKTACMV